jgi:hypothetical protein
MGRETLSSGRKGGKIMQFTSFINRLKCVIIAQKGNFPSALLLAGGSLMLTRRKLNLMKGFCGEV